MRRQLPRLGFPLAVLLLGVTIAGCGTSTPRTATAQTTPETPIVATPTTPANSSANELTGVTWVLTGMLVDGVERPVSAHGGQAPSLQFRSDLGQVIGNAGCNSYGGPYTLDGDALRLKALGQTLMACANPVMEVEDDYLAALQRVERFAVSDGGSTLTLSSDDGSVRLTYHRS